nr:hypothetical protein [Candidatus Kapabacteria bacterium]
MKKYLLFGRKVLLSLFAVLVLIVACTESTTEPVFENTVAGILTDTYGMAVPGAFIEASMKTTNLKGANIANVFATDTTDENGRFDLSDLPDDLTQIAIRISHPDFDEVLTDLETLRSDNDKSNIQVVMNQKDECVGKIELTITDKNETPLSGVEVKLRRNGELVRYSETNSEGVLLFENVCPGEYGLRIFNDGYSVIEKGINVPENDSTLIKLPITLSAVGEPDSCCDGKIYLIIKDEVTKEILEGAHVTIWKNGDKLDIKISEGEFVLFENLCEGTYAFDIVLEGYKHIEFSIEIGCNETKEVVKYLKGEADQDTCCNGKIYVIPRDAETEELLKGAMVNIFKDGQKIGSKIVEEGYVLFEDLCPGKYNLNIIMEHYKGPEFSVELECNGVAEIHKDLI